MLVLSGRGLYDELITRPERSPTDCGASLCVICCPDQASRIFALLDKGKLRETLVCLRALVLRIEHGTATIGLFQ